jgi:hypothetical protein
MKKLLVATSLLVLSGCMSMGTQVSDTQMSTLQKGVTTEAEVTTRLGKPNGIVKSSAGNTSYIYTFSKSSPDAASFIPVVGIFAGKTTSTTTTVTLNFNQAGILQDYTTSNTDMQAGLFNYTSQTTNQ